jgi:DinB superfamily
MDDILKTAFWGQFGSAIDMLENALQACPEELWHVRLSNDRSLPPGFSEFWYVASHTLFWLDLYLSGSVEGFAPPAPFTLVELDPAGVLPERTYTRDELLVYLEHDRQKCRATIETLTDERARQPCQFSWGEASFLELLLDNMRHVQEHAAQLNLVLGQEIGFAPRWITKPKSA